MKRRKFLKITATSAPMLGCFRTNFSAIDINKSYGMIEKRTLGKTGEKLSVLGFGGIVVTDSTPEDASQRVKEAIEHGINYFDVAPTYGNAEIMLGPALEPYRKDVFLACKTMERTKEGSREELEQSLVRMRTDHFDLYQLHAVTKLEEVDEIFNTGGAIETFLQARKEGKIRFIGFSAHSVEAAMALLERFDFDTILFPVNYTTWHAGNFGPQVLARAQEKEMGILALKAMAKGPWPEGATNKIEKCWYEPLTDPEEALLGLRFTLSHPLTSAIPPGDENLFKMALELSDRLEPLSSKEVEEIKEKALKGIPLFTHPAEG